MCVPTSALAPAAPHAWHRAPSARRKPPGSRREALSTKTAACGSPLELTRDSVDSAVRGFIRWRLLDSEAMWTAKGLAPAAHRIWVVRRMCRVHKSRAHERSKCLAPLCLPSMWPWPSSTDRLDPDAVHGHSVPLGHLWRQVRRQGKVLQVDCLVDSRRQGELHAYVACDHLPMAWGKILRCQRCPLVISSWRNVEVCPFRLTPLR
mmetsp:Transcript_19537/g.43145  ORF Transcript_19537/g.43145 Transcript_19537/m.43145 type:complete len:206 (+) Transcript_19537:495-1112(+)